MIYLTVHLRDANVELWPDGRTLVSLSRMTVARHDLSGYVWVEADGTIGSSVVEDAYVRAPLSPYAVRAARNAALRQARKARRVARQIAATTKPPVRREPDTLEYLVLRAEGKVRKDGWPKGKGPLA